MREQVAKGTIVATVTRTSRLPLRYATASKRAVVGEIVCEYGRVVNFFIARFWESPVSKGALLKPIVDAPLEGLDGGTWLNYALRQTAAREALGMISASKERWGARAVLPVHKGLRMRISTGNLAVKDAEEGCDFDLWARLSAGTKDGRKMTVRLPLALHKHYRKLAARGKRCGSYIVSEDEIVFTFQEEVEDPKGPEEGGRRVGLDTGMKALASLSTGKQVGRGMKALIDAIARHPRGSKAEERARRRLKQFIDEAAKKVAAQGYDLVVAEDLTGISHGTKRRTRLRKTMRVSIGNWNWRYWMGRLQTALALNRVRLEFVEPAYTSQTCNQCLHVDRGNRNGESFRCRSCGHMANADVNAAKNILAKFLGGVQGPV